jgi:putative tricarboxylic transport membrane protein
MTARLFLNPKNTRGHRPRLQLLNRDLVAGLVLSGSGMLITRYSQTLSYLDEYGPGPGFLPYWLGLILTALAFCLVISAVRTRTQVPKPAGQGSGRALLTLGGLFSMVAVLEWLGFVASFALLSFFMIYAVERRSFARSIAVAAAITFGFFLLFRVIIPLPLPVNAWGF